MNRLVLVDSDTVFERERHDHAARLLSFGRPQESAKGNTLLLFSGASRQQWEAFEPKFAGAFPVYEAYSQSIAPARGQPLFLLTTPPTRLDRLGMTVDSEASTHRIDLGQRFHFVIPVTSSTSVYATNIDVLDLCDDPWLEWVHPPTDHAKVFAAFREYRQTPVAWQWSQLTYKSPNWRVEAEPDSPEARRHFGRDLAPFRQSFPRGPFPAVQLEIFQIEPTLGSITLIWSESPGAAGYRLYTNGVPGNTTMTQQKLTITSLTLGQAYTYAIVAVNGYGEDASNLSNVVMYEHGVNEVMAVYGLSSDNPDGGL